MNAEANNPYGYKVCYKEDGAKDYTSHFKTYTYRQAIKAKAGYIRYPPRSREDGHILRNPKWVIIPIKHSEVRDGIWHEGAESKAFQKANGSALFYANQYL